MNHPVTIDPERLARVTAKLAANVRRDASGCLLWLGYTQPNGYGWLNVAGLKLPAHRAALLVAGRDSLKGLDVCHTCDVRRCVEPSHLYVGTRKQNMADCSERRRHNKPHGSAHWCAKLADEAVVSIRSRRAAGERCESIAQAFNIHPATVSRIARRQWRGEVA